MSVRLALRTSPRTAIIVLVSTITAACGPLHSILITPHHGIVVGIIASSSGRLLVRIVVILCDAPAFLRALMVVGDDVGVLAADTAASTVDFGTALGDR